MPQQVLVAYATKYGATKEITERIGAVLEEAGLQADVRSVDDVGDVTDYGAVVLGIAVYIGKWRKEGVKFLEANEAQLAQMPVWLFSSGPTGEGDPVELMKGWRMPEAQEPLVERIAPREVVVFHGALDSSKLNFIEKQMIKMVKAPTGDFRDWDAISAWAKSIAESLNEDVPVADGEGK